MMYLQKLIELKQSKKMTNAQIAEISKIPLATITRVLNGSTANPTFETIAQIAIAMGASLDEITGLSGEESAKVDFSVGSVLNTYSDLIKEKDDHIAELKQERNKERKEKIIVAMVLGVFLVLAFAILGIDVTNGTFGYFRY